MDDEVIKQQNLLAKTLDITVNNMEAASKFYQEKAKELVSLIDQVTVLMEAQKRSLSESDAQIDDLAKITSALLTLHQQQQQQTQGQ